MSQKQSKQPVNQPTKSRKWWYIAGAVWVPIIVVFLIRRSEPASDASSRSAARPGPQLLAPVVKPDSEVHPNYGGSASCIDCHSVKYKAWETSNHALAERLPNLELDLEAFEPKREFAYGTLTSEARKDGDRIVVKTKGFDGAEEDYEVVRVIGHDPLRQFLIDGGNGRLQTLEASYDPHKDEWFNVYGDEDRQPGEWGHWTGRGMNWNAMCASCHNTRLRKNYDEATDSYHTSMAEMTVSCEACHGPMKKHVLDYKAGTTSTVTNTLDKIQIMQTCAGCHSRRGQLTDDFEPGDDYYDHFHLTVPDFSDIYYPDGQVMGENYVFGSFTGSRMHAAGVTCLDCHDPHTTKLILPGNYLCMRCHNGGFPDSPKIDPTAHSFHEADSTGNQCVNCHMPHTTYMQRHPRRDHGFTIPDPLLTKELGIPNACNRCHTDKDTEWALAAVEKNYGDKMDRHTRHRARWIAGARRGDDSVKPQILGMLNGDDTPYWQSVAANLVDPWLGDALVQTALKNALTSTNALVRSHAARAMEPLAQAHLPAAEAALKVSLKDPVRAVRVNAAWAIREELDFSSLAARELDHFLRINSDQPGGQLQLGTWMLAKNDPSAALSHFQKAVRWDPNSAPLHHELAVLYSMLNRPGDALKSLQEAVRLEPRHAEFHYKLALGWNELSNLQEVVQALENAVRLDPQHARAWYNLGLARNSQGQPTSAIDALLRGETADPNDPRIPYARATILAQLGRPDEARTAAERALALEPGYSSARALIDSLR